MYCMLRNEMVLLKFLSKSRKIQRAKTSLTERNEVNEKDYVYNII